MTLVVCTLLLGLYSASALVVGTPKRAPLRYKSTIHMQAEATLPLAKIVATIGPASEEQDTLSKCVKSGLSVMRCNFSHATSDEFFLRVGNMRKAPGGERVNLMLDTKGPEIRMGGLKICKETGNRKAKIEMVKGEMITLTNDPAYDGASDEKLLYVGYEALTEKLVVGTKVLLDDGLISMVVTKNDG